MEKMKVTSAYANKMLKKLNEDKDFYVAKERESSFYIVSNDEEPVVPEYDYKETADCIAAIDEKIVKIKHAINMVNVTSKVDVNGEQMSVDEILVKMAQLNRRKSILDEMRKRQPKARYNIGSYSRNPVPEYIYINYDLDLVKQEYEKVDAYIAAMQIALDKFNQTFEFEIEF